MTHVKLCIFPVVLYKSKYKFFKKQQFTICKVVPNFFFFFKHRNIRLGMVLGSAEQGNRKANTLHIYYITHKLSEQQNSSLELAATPFLHNLICTEVV